MAKSFRNHQSTLDAESRWLGKSPQPGKSLSIVESFPMFPIVATAPRVGRPKPGRAFSPAVLPRQDGFALVLALSLMSFILLLVISIMSLTQVELRNSGTQQAELKAQQNAQLALAMAIGELQKLAGPDTRITGPAEAIANVNGPKQITGVWRSWEGLDHNRAGPNAGLTTIPPDYASKLARGSLEPSSNDPDRFLGWLVSDSSRDGEPNDPPLLEEGAGTIPLLSANALGEGTGGEVHIRPTEFGNNSRDCYAWWITGENTKAQVGYREAPENSGDTAVWAGRSATFGAADMAVFGFELNSKLNMVSTRTTMDLLTADPPPPADSRSSGLHFHDLTAWNRGLLTNAATGGWKRDLSLMTEDWDRLPETDLPFFTLAPGLETSARKALGINGEILPPQSLIYPWGSVFLYGNKTSRPRRQPVPVVSWDALKDFCLQYREIESGNNGRVVMPAFAANAGRTSAVGDWRDRVRRFPIVARMHWVFSYAAERNPNATAMSNAFRFALDANPAITIWNPYNVELTVDALKLSVEQTTPFTFTFTLTPAGGGTPNTFKKVGMRQFANGRVDINLLDENGGSEITLQPGEARIFSPRDNQPVVGSDQLDLYPGYRTRGGFRYYRLDGDGLQEIVGGPADRISATIRMDADNVAGAKSGEDGKIKPGIDFTFTDPDNEWGTDFREWGQINANKVQVTLTNPDPGDGPASKLSLFSLANNPDPFIATFITRTTATANEKFGKGVLRGSPLTFVAYTSFVSGEHNPHRWEFFPLNGTNGGDGLPDNLGLVGISHQVNSGGLTHLVMAELPLRPLRSLGELQHFDITATNYAPPFVFNVIGNSHAYPLFERNEAFTSDGGSALKALAYDHSYASNHLLFDDWFVSSIAPETGAWSRNFVREKEEVYADHLSQAEPLPNHFYRPRLPAASSAASSLAADHLGSEDAWRNIAAELEVEGMFNANSTSPQAWRSVLRNLRDAKVPVFNLGSNSWSLGLEGASAETPVSRSTVAGSPIDNDIGNYPELGSYRSLTDSQIDALAEAIVEQVKKRGPFLSLSEFVNRQLTDDVELARAGTIEAALLELSENGSPSENPNGLIQSILPTRSSADDSTLRFPEADEGYIAYGFPGWIRQADILRSLAPILSVRDDTFLIRAYGEYSNPATGELSKAWCEAVVQRKADFVDPADDLTTLPSVNTLVSEANQRFGRRFEIIRLSWLSEDEI